MISVLLILYAMLLITYLTGESLTRVSRSLLPRPHQNTYPTPMPLQQQKSDASNERQILLALQALQQDATLSQRRAAAIYRVPQKTLSDRRAGRPSRADSMPKSRSLTTTEEQVIVGYILELDARGFSPRLAAIADMANSLRAERGIGHVGLNWPSTFVKRQPELVVKFNRKYAYKRALCEDPKVI